MFLLQISVNKIQELSNWLEMLLGLGFLDVLMMSTCILFKRCSASMLCVQFQNTGVFFSIGLSGDYHYVLMNLDIKCQLSYPEPFNFIPYEEK